MALGPDYAGMWFSDDGLKQANPNPNSNPNPTRTPNPNPTPTPTPDPDPGSTQVWWTPQREVRVLTLSPSHGPVLGGTRMEVLRGLQPEPESEPEP